MDGNAGREAGLQGLLMAPPTNDGPYPMSLEEPLRFMWLAGILEGEGSFWILKKNRPSGGHYRYPKISVVMTDRDVIEWVAVLFGDKAVTEQTPRGNRQMTYRTNLTGQPALEMMCRLFHYMSSRRQRRIRELFDEFMPDQASLFVPRSSSGS
jgi:hypothetical protein